ncbi:MAG: GTPase HflX [Rhizobiaceae bacterium]|nr:GTPase HflX [Rhizobiaceae bacterium]
MTDHKKSNPTKFQWTAEQAQKPERAIVIVPEFTQDAQRSREARLEEAIGLARAISLDVVDSTVILVKRVTPATLIGKGRVDELAGVIAAQDIGLAIIDHAISPKQQQNLEKAWNCKVLDRTGLILEIFGERAQTKEGRLQVELAHLNYQKGRLVRTWTHLERQRGGLGFVGGPGETQIEADRRMIQERINRLERDLEKVRKTRSLHRSKRKKVPYPVVALVGYTNAGKSTLFNRLTGADVMAKDLLFATLDPTLRQLNLPEGTRVILSDTVGFVSNLPTHLVAAFRATLEEVIEAELILHVRDISHEDTDAQANDVYDILDQLGVGEKNSSPVVEVWNKIDLLDDAPKDAMSERTVEEVPPIMVSAQTGEGVDELLARIEQRIGDPDNVIEIMLPLKYLNLLPQLYQDAQVLERHDEEDGSVSLKLRVPKSLRNTVLPFRISKA